MSLCVFRHSDSFSTNRISWNPSPDTVKAHGLIACAEAAQIQYRTHLSLRAGLFLGHL